MPTNINDENPVGMIGIDHLEFCCESLNTETRDLFYKFGFTDTYSSENKLLLSQGQIRFLLNADSKSHSREYYKKHGEGVSTISFLVEDAEHAYKTTLERGGELVRDLKIVNSDHGTYKSFAIKGFGDVLNELIERPKEYFRPNYKKVKTNDSDHSLTTRVARIDHLTNNVPKGEMSKWVEFYKKVYGFKVTRYFDIKGVKTGLQSEVVQLANGNIIIPINEPDAENGKSQIQEFLDLHKGAGVQHIALMTPDIVSTVGQLQERGIEFLEIPHTYYEDIHKRGIKHTEDLDILESRQLLVDGDSEGYLIQNFTKTYIGPLFFEIIQRKNNWGFGEGNFQALFDSIERDQMQRGYINE